MALFFLKLINNEIDDIFLLKINRYYNFCKNNLFCTHKFSLKYNNIMLYDPFNISMSSGFNRILS